MSETMTPSAKWTHDCQGKQDYDGRLLSISTRYWPGREKAGAGTMTFDAGTGKFGTAPYGEKPSAHASIVLNFGELGFQGDGKAWREAEFEAFTEAEVKAQVEAWVQARFDEVRVMLGMDD